MIYVYNRILCLSPDFANPLFRSCCTLLKPQNSDYLIRVYVSSLLTGCVPRNVRLLWISLDNACRHAREVQLKVVEISRRKPQYGIQIQ